MLKFAALEELKREIMSASCCNKAVDIHRGDEGYRRVLWAVLLINAVMFAVEVAAGFASRSASLQARCPRFSQ